MGVTDYAGIPPKEEAGNPSGRLQVLEPKDFSYLHTGKSLVFVIARNGHVWGKRLDEQSSKGDIELEVFWPREDGCFLRINTSGSEPKEVYGMPFILREALINPIRTNHLTRSQVDKIELILSQKETIQYELGTLMVRPGIDTTDYNFQQALPYRRMDKLVPRLRLFNEEQCNIKVVDCSYDPHGSKWQPSRQWSWKFCYDDALFDFQFYSRDIYDGKKTRVIGTREDPISFRDISKHESEWDSGVTMIVKKFFAARLSGGKFDMSGVRLRSNARINPSLRIMYGEYDFFEYFGIDDAVLVLEEETCSADFPNLYWTLGIAQNKHVREMMRLASNNPDLFKPLTEMFLQHFHNCQMEPCAIGHLKEKA